LSGHVMADESYEEAAKRELKEELGIDAEPKPLFKLEFEHKPENEIMTYFVVENYDGKIKLSKKEVDSGEFVSSGDLIKNLANKKKKFTPAFVLGLKQLLGK